MQNQATISNWPNKNALSVHFPRLLAAITIVLAASFLSENYDGQVMLFALLLGIAFNFYSEPGKRCILSTDCGSLHSQIGNESADQTSL